MDTAFQYWKSYFSLEKSASVLFDNIPYINENFDSNQS